MANFRTIPWLRISAESTAIIASILIAFAIDAWWQEKTDRSQEADLLAKLHVEISNNISTMDEAQYRIGLNETIKFFDAVEAALANEESSIEFSTKTFRRSMHMSSFEADTPVLNSIIGSGRLDLIENSEILAALADWESEVRSYTELVVRSRQHFDTQFMPALIDRSDVGFVLIRRRAISEFPNRQPDWIVAGPNETTIVKIDSELKGIIGARIHVVSIAMANLTWAQEAGEQLIESIKVARSN